MPDSLKSFAAKLKSFSFENETLRIVEENKDKLADLQAEQWAQSKNVNGEDIQLIDNPEYGYGYRPYTKDLKKKYGRGLGAVTDRVTLFQTGELYKSLFETITKKYFTLTSDKPYYKELMDRTNEADGLDEERRRTFGQDVYLPELKNVLKEKTGINF